MKIFKLKAIILSFCIVAGIACKAKNPSEYPSPENIVFYASFTEDKQPEINKTGKPIKWEGKVSLEKDTGVQPGTGTVCLDIDGCGMLDKRVINIDEGTLAFWFYPIGDPLGGSHTYMSWKWNFTWPKAEDKKAYMIISQGWFENAGGESITYGAFSNTFRALSIREMESCHRWVHYAMTWKRQKDGTFQWCLYRNGSDTKSAPGYYPPPSNMKLDSPVYLGVDKGAGSTQRFADGCFNELVFYDKALSGEEIKQILTLNAPDYVKEEINDPFYWAKDFNPAEKQRTKDGILRETRMIFSQGPFLTFQIGKGKKEIMEETIKILDRLKSTGFNAVFPVVWYGAGLWVNSKTFPLAPTYKAYLEKINDTSYDHYSFLIKEAHKRGIEVHSVFTITKAHGNSLGNNIPVWSDFLADSSWYNGYDSKFRDKIVALMIDHIKEYDIDGINLDYIRIQTGLDSKVAAEEYKRLFNRELKMDRYDKNKMAEFTSLCVDDIVERTANKARKINPKVIISADVSPQLQRYGLASNGRNPRDWVNQGWIDVAFNMDYAKIPGITIADLTRQESKRQEAWTFLLGNHDMEEKGWASRSPELLMKQVRYFCGKYGNGIGIYMLKRQSPEQEKQLKEFFKEPAVPFWRK